ncbi:MAG: BON domain-containing protein [Methylophilus sp.]|nr:BON domain-containing protein [Methylophilus sp.]
MKVIPKLILSIALASQIGGCVPAVVGGAAVGGSMATDRRTSGIYLEDENIELKATRKMETNLGEYSHVSITSYNRNVLLTGQVPDAAKKALALTLMKEIENVRNITDEIVVGPKTSISTRTNDTYITSKVKAQFVTENRFNANHVKVVTEDSTVFLMGLVTKQEAEDAVDIARNNSGVEKVVKVFEYIN